MSQSINPAWPVLLSLARSSLRGFPFRLLLTLTFRCCLADGCCFVSSLIWQGSSLCWFDEWRWWQSMSGSGRSVGLLRVALLHVCMGRDKAHSCHFCVESRLQFGLLVVLLAFLCSALERLGRWSIRGSHCKLVSVCLHCALRHSEY